MGGSSENADTAAEEAEVPGRCDTAVVPAHRLHSVQEPQEIV